MADDYVTVHLILGLLDQHSFKTLENSVQEFKDHKQQFHESLCELKRLIPSAENVLNCLTNTSHSEQAKCSPPNPPSAGDFLHVSSQARCTPLKPPLNSMLDLDGIENRGCRPYSLRPRASRKQSTSGAPQRITRSRAKQPTVSSDAVCRNANISEFFVLEDKFVKDCEKITKKPGGYQHTCDQDHCPSEAAVSACAEICPSQSLEQLAHSQDGINITSAKNVLEICNEEELTSPAVKINQNSSKETYTSQDVSAGHKQPEMCRGGKTPLSSTTSLHPGKDPFGCGDSILESRSRKQSHLGQHMSILNNSGFSCQNIANFEGEQALLHHDGGTSGSPFATGAAVCVKSPSARICLPMPAGQSSKQTIDASHCTPKHEEQNLTDPKKNNTLSLGQSLIASKHSCPSACPDSDGKDVRLRNSLKRKLSDCGGPTCGTVGNDSLTCRKRISVNSCEVEGYRFDIDDTFPGTGINENFNFDAMLCKLDRASLGMVDISGQAKGSVFKGVSTPRIKGSSKVNELNIGTVETELKKSCGVLLQAHHDTAGGGTHAIDLHLQGVTESILEGKRALPDTFEVSIPEVHQGCEVKEPMFNSSEDSHKEIRGEKTCQGSSVLKGASADQQPLVSNSNSPADCVSALVQPEQERRDSLRGTTGLVPTASEQLEPCLHEFAEKRALAQLEPSLHEFPEENNSLGFKMLINSTDALASGTAVKNDDLPFEAEASVKVKLSPSLQNGKDTDILLSPKLKSALTNHIAMNPGMGLPPALSIEQMKLNCLLSASKSVSKCDSINRETELYRDNFVPNLMTDGKSVSVPTSLSRPMSSVGEEGALENVRMGADVDILTEHTRARDTVYDINVKPMFYKETEEGINTRLCGTFESTDVEVVAHCGLASKESTETPWQLTYVVEALPNPNLEEGRQMIEETKTLRKLCEPVSESSPCAKKDALPANAFELEDCQDRSSKSSLLQSNSTAQLQSPPILQEEAGMAVAVSQTMAEIKETKKCCSGIQAEMPCEAQCNNSTMKMVSLGEPSSCNIKDELRIDLSRCIPTVDMIVTASERDDEEDVNCIDSQMDCSESPCLSLNFNQINAGKDEQRGEVHRENSTTEEWKVTPKGDEDVKRFNQLLALGTVNSSRRKRARSPAICSEEDEAYKELKRMKLSVIDSGGQLSDKALARTFLSHGPSFGSSSSPIGGLPSSFSPIRSFQDTFGKTCLGSSGELPCNDDFGMLKMLGNDSNDELCKSYPSLSGLRREYLDTPHMKSARARLDNKTNRQTRKYEWHLNTHLEESGKENQSPELWSKDTHCSSTGLLLEGHSNTDTRKVLGNSNQTFGGLAESAHKRYNLAVETRSFLTLVQQKAVPLPYPNGKREVRVKALEAAELARRQEERRENERKARKYDYNESKPLESEGLKDRTMLTCASTTGIRITDKVKRVAELKMKMDLEKAKKQEVERRKREEERKKKEVELADKKRKREDADRRDREEKRKRVEEVQRLKKEQEERQRMELEEKEHRRKLLEERERERKAQEEEAKKQRRLEKEKEAERRRRQEQHFKASRLAERQAERKRREDMLQAKGFEDDHIAHLTSNNKLSFLSTESFAVSTSMDWDTQSKSIIRTRSQTSEDVWRHRVLNSVQQQTSNDKLSTSSSFVDNRASFSTKAVGNEPGAFKFEALKVLKSQYPTPSNSRLGGYTLVPQPQMEINYQSYEISPYKSCSDDDDEDDQPKKPVPLWARKENLLPQLLWQQCMDPDDIFSTDRTCSLREIFGTAGSRRCKDFTQRSKSGDWLDDHATRKEELEYKKAMGYIQG